MIKVQIDCLGGNCPVQADGTFNGYPFYFSARRDKVSIRVAKIGGDPLETSIFDYVEPYPSNDAGWMGRGEATEFIYKAGILFEQFLNHDAS